MRFKVIILILFAVACVKQSYGQSKEELIIASYRQKTGNSRDILTDLFRLSANNLNSENGELSFTSTLYALRLRKNKLLAIDQNYVKQTFSRNFQISLGLRSSEKALNFTQGTFGLAYSLINRRDKSIANFKSEKDYDLIMADIIQLASARYMSIEKDTSKRNPMVRATYKMLNSNSTVIMSIYKALDPVYKNLLDSVALTMPTKENIAGLIQKRRQEYSDQAELINRKALLTLDGKIAYDVKGGIASMGQTNLRYLKGLGKNPQKKAVELEIRAGLNFEMDTNSTRSGNLSRMRFNSTLGLNGVLLEDGNNESILELKLFASYDNIIQRAYTGETQEIFAANAAFRIKISDNIWVPVTIKYDISNSNFLGLLNVAWNLEKGEEK